MLRLNFYSFAREGVSTNLADDQNQMIPGMTESQGDVL